MLNVFQPDLGEKEVNAVREVFESNWIGKGKRVDKFEESFAEHVGVEKNQILSTNCCSEGLFSSMHLMDIQPGDEVIVPTISFVGAGNAVCVNGSKLVLCDVNPRTLNVRAEDIEKVLTKKSKAILLLHFGGIACEMDEIMQLAEEHHLKVIEDCAAGVCSTYKGRALGTIGDMGMWSFDAMKILVCGDGACLYFRDPEIRNRAEKWLYFGLETKSGYENKVAQKWWEFEISSFGHRAVMNDMTAAVAQVQLGRLSEFMECRKKVHEAYTAMLEDVAWIDLPPELQKDCKTSYYFYHIQVKNDKRDALAGYLKEKGIYTTYRYYPLHRVEAYQASGEFPNADYATEHTLCLPMHQKLNEDHVQEVVEAIKAFGRVHC